MYSSFTPFISTRPFHRTPADLEDRREAARAGHDPTGKNFLGVGQWVNHTTSTSPVRIEEDLRGISATSSVTMKVTVGRDNCAMLNICMKVDEGYNIKNKLFKPTKT
jgi:hypothetical protein